MAVTWHVYQFRSEADELLYVGYSRWLRRRISTHRREKSWWPEVADVKSEEFATEEEARQREKELWAAGRPKYNRQSPFLTADEDRAQRRAKNASVAATEYRREYNRSEKAREANLRYNKTDKARERGRRHQAKRRQRTWRQTGPGLW